MAQSSLPEKLRIKDGRLGGALRRAEGVLLAARPAARRRGGLTSPRGDCDVVLGFVETISDATAIVPKLTACAGRRRVLWVCYPKLTSARAGELSRDVLWTEVAKHRPPARGLVALDDTWSAMRFVPGRDAERKNMAWKNAMGSGKAKAVSGPKFPTLLKTHQA